MTQVSVEGLKKVKQALQDFKNQTALMSYTVTNHNQSCQSDASKSVNKTRQTVEELMQKVKTLENKIQELKQSDSAERENDSGTGVTGAGKCVRRLERWNSV